MKLSILLRTSVFRGDHEADVSTAVEPKPDETIAQLAERLLGTEGQYGPNWRYDFIEIRRTAEPAEVVR